MASGETRKGRGSCTAFLELLELLPCLGRCELQKSMSHAAA